VRIALIVVLLVAFVLEALTPGFGIFGSLAIIALLLLVGAPALVGLAEWWELIAVVLGLALVALDIVILPLGGWVAVIGGGLVLTGLVSSFVTRDISSAIGQQQLFMGIGSTLVGLFGSTAILWFSWKFLPQSPLLRRATLQVAASSQSSDAILIPSNWPQVGSQAIAITTLRPTGIVQVDNQPFDAQTNGEFVEAGTTVRIVRRRGTTLEVEVLLNDAPHGESADQGQSST
jgi:membrane-bound serine protease (ClpP class)